MQKGHDDRLEEILAILRSEGAILGAIAYCQQLFGHPKIEKLTTEERRELTILIREKMLVASMSVGHHPTGRASQPLQ